MVRVRPPTQHLALAKHRTRWGGVDSTSNTSNTSNTSRTSSFSSPHHSHHHHDPYCTWLENAIPTTTTHPHPHKQGKEGKVFFRRNDRYRTHGPKEFTFDRVFSSKATQATVYREVATPLVDGLFEHINGCVVAYGQTGAGKTYTVVGPDNDVIKHTEEHAHRLGLVPRAIHDVFERIERKKQ